MLDTVKNLLLNHAPWLLALSLLSLLLTALIVPALILKLPADYFTDRRHHRLPHRHPLAHALLRLLKNLAALGLLLAGLVMLFTPGQGLLTLLAGSLLLDFPGKYRLERWLIGRPAVYKSLNALRRRAGKPPFRRPETI